MPAWPLFLSKDSFKSDTASLKIFSRVSFSSSGTHESLKDGCEMAAMRKSRSKKSSANRLLIDDIRHWTSGSQCFRFPLSGFVERNFLTRTKASKNEFHRVWTGRTNRDPSIFVMKSEALELPDCFIHTALILALTFRRRVLKCWSDILDTSVVVIRFNLWQAQRLWGGRLKYSRLSLGFLRASFIGMNPT